MFCNTVHHIGVMMCEEVRAAIRLYNSLTIMWCWVASSRESHRCHVCRDPSCLESIWNHYCTEVNNDRVDFPSLTTFIGSVRPRIWFQQKYFCPKWIIVWAITSPTHFLSEFVVVVVEPRCVHSVLPPHVVLQAITSLNWLSETRGLDNQKKLLTI